VKGWEPNTYGDAIADVYDELYAHVDPTDAVEALAKLAGGGKALELAIGTGRIALPLSRRGVEVHGIDASEAMIAALRAKPAAEKIRVVRGDFADVDIDGSYEVVFIAFNTFFLLTTQEDQARCFANVARRLAPGGVFAVEAFVPDPGRFTNGQTVQAPHVEHDHVTLEASRHDRATQTIRTQLVVLRESGTRLLPIVMRYAWPSELDLMARLAGLRLRERWTHWSRAPFGSASAQHVSIYELAG
jgi:SAM-dependent methyltransferase